jgi:hypothetical protein
MTLNEWIAEQTAAAADPEVCTLPVDDFNPVELSIAITTMGCHAPAGKFGYLAQLANNPDAAVARDALEQLKPIHPGARAAEEDGPEWKAFAAASAALNSIRKALPTAWLLYK